MSLNPQKSALRKKIKATRQALTPEERTQKNTVIQAQLEKLPEFQAAKTVLFYVSTDEEAGTHEIIKKYLDKKHIVVPTIQKETKEFQIFDLTDWNELEPGVFGILEIHHKDRVTHPLNNIDLIIVPGVAFDKSGYRLGYGGGYYDSLLTIYPKPSIGLSYECQLVDEVPCDPHDQPVDKIITEQQIIISNPN
ncbi:5-formyltetrahydrofolate cyclo-ligase [Candidatus Peregrinibacteria bacterium]|jgi:5-formyltetrahydrofolate cyclo-ligase|nr:5-formyltetrahydrofolate cyclo-ligase [Candidatus Peregrinibacteria bacterium]MBT7702945.1 5-formyltetrahydrofolate cyclo-ligase [Candidatus Peregrinibacteria bacterium]